MICRECYVAALCSIFFVILASTKSDAYAEFVPPPHSRNRSSSSPTTVLPTLNASASPTSEKHEKTTNAPIVPNEIDTKLKEVQNGVRLRPRPYSYYRTSQKRDNTSVPVSDEKIKRTIQEGIIRFSLKFQHVSPFNATDKNKNIIFAPVNILASLATLLLGSEADTEDEILNLLEFYAGRDPSEKYSYLKIHAIFGDLFANFTAESSLNLAVETKMNRGIFYQTETQLKEDFDKYAKRFYNNELIPLNFSTGDDTPVKAINDWVSNHTEKRITEVVIPHLPVGTNLVLVNTLFFNGEWEIPFYVKSTMSDFFPEIGPPVKVKTMRNAGSLYYYYNHNHSYSVIGLPYKGDETVMYIILPDRGQKLNNVLSKIRSQDLHEIMSSTERNTDCTYTLPHLHLSDITVGLRVMLERLGVISIFDPVRVNLSKIAENLGLYLSEVVHNINLNVTEAGSTGAASTAIITETVFPRRKVVLINRPFTFYIIHRPSGMISFWGSIYDPLANS